ncbi:hypothetical protein BKA70DRAFT_1242402 [Coprinopsis sp. MPI-PUGE-AT-0042]|nr:hypothetical protein BKA70DRAFT_1242402 [Coprinopsis sp. MPI-PUGE-AT-0042]
MYFAAVAARLSTKFVAIAGTLWTITTVSPHKRIDRLRPYQTRRPIKPENAVKAHVGPSSSPPLLATTVPANRVAKANVMRIAGDCPCLHGCVLAKEPASELLSRWYALPGATHSRGELIWLHPTTYFASALSFDQGKVARLNTAIVLFDKKGSILESAWAEANLRHAEILRITPECLISHSLGSKCVPCGCGAYDPTVFNIDNLVI